MSHEQNQNEDLPQMVKIHQNLEQKRKNSSLFTNKKNEMINYCNESKINTINLIPSLNYFILRQSGHAKSDQVNNKGKIKTEKKQKKSDHHCLKRALSEPNLVMDRTDCFCSINKKYKNFKLLKKRLNIIISNFNLINFLKYLFTFRYCRMSNRTNNSKKRIVLGRSISLDWIDKRTFLIYKISHQLSIKSKFKNKNDKINKNYLNFKKVSHKSIGSFIDSQNEYVNSSINLRSHSCFAPQSVSTISLKESLANLNRIKHHDILEEAILNFNGTKELNYLSKPFAKSESKRSFFNFKGINYGSKRKKNSSSSCLSIFERIDLRDYVDKKSEINDNVLHRFLESERSHSRRSAICARIDKLYRNKELINFMEYLLREDYIQNFLM